ncbi:MAG: hypothetical protein ABIS45_02975 [Burkholderiales bacterium]
MQHGLKRATAGITLAVAATALHADDIFTVAPELWDRPRVARAVLDQPAVRQALKQYLARPGARLVIHHGYDQAPLLQAEELRMWLMALAVDGSRVSLIKEPLIKSQTVRPEVSKGERFPSEESVFVLLYISTNGLNQGFLNNVRPHEPLKIEVVR